MNIHQKLLEVKKQVPYLQKNKKSFQYSYTTPSQVFAVINPILNELGLLLITNVTGSRSQRIEIETSKGIKKEWLYDLDFIFTWVDVDTQEKIDVPFKASGCNGEEKGLGSALTYAERYFILKQFNIPTDDDDPDSFQAKHMSEDDKKAAKEDQERTIQQLQTAEAEKRQRDINSHIAKLANCNNVEELKTLKSILPPWVLKEKQFNNAATERFLKVKEKDLQPA